jgi:hypothetical protein
VRRIINSILLHLYLRNQVHLFRNDWPDRLVFEEMTLPPELELLGSLPYSDSYAASYFVHVALLLLGVPATSFWFLKGVYKGVNQRKDPDVVGQFWMLQYLLLFFDMNGGNIIGSLILGQTPGFTKFTSFFVLWTFALW